MKRRSLAKTAAAFLLFGTLGYGAYNSSALAELMFTNTVTGEPLDFSQAPEEGRDTPAVKHFLETGENLYIENKLCLPKGEELFLTMCSGCHGHYGEGKIGPGLNDSYWTYPGNATNKGIFETVYGGATGQMGPMYGALNLNEMLLVIAWVRHFYKDDVKDATWLTPEQQKAFKAFNHDTNPIQPSDVTPPECGGTG
ncbi:cytochrome c(L), periplasmic [Ancylobacter sp. 6x-1]|uniref:Cytochrome c(L), periplasmic n=1 Tax=Ancylobacter crimeensis TaxID=2579147 RepID=A0ABT0DDY0_9HYPH|nr:cytochrome c(L), periplasmic [Ancylobacter crimeensis]MCK0197957.1 cytochrome c(L), periplasmic [Ancylobacter crimeensis]